MEELLKEKRGMDTGFDCMRRVHTPPLWGDKKGMYPETNTLPKQPYPICSAAGLVDYEFLDAIIGETGCKATAVIPVLQGIQEKYNYLPPEIFPYVAEKLRVSETRIYGVATFYENFSLEPKGRYIIKVCDGTACHVRKSVPNLEQFRKELSLSESKITTDDLGFTVQTVACLGACSLAPALTVNNKVYAAMTPEKVSALIKELRMELVKEEGN